MQVIFLSKLNHNNSIQKHPARVRSLLQTQFLELPPGDRAVAPLCKRSMVSSDSQSDHSRHPIPSAVQIPPALLALSFSCLTKFAGYILLYQQFFSAVLLLNIFLIKIFA